MYVLKIQWKGTCPRHRKYNPRLQGEAGIKGGCSTCFALHDALMLSDKLCERLAEIRKVLEGQIK